MALFDPDGRNDIQYAGHLAVEALYYGAVALGVICLAPAVLFVYVREDLHVQEATIEAFRENAPVQTLVVDYNTPTFTVADVEAADRAHGGDVNPPATSLPFSIEVGPSRKALEVGKITPRWVNSYLSFSAGVLDEKDPQAYDPTPLYSLDALRYRHGCGGGYAFGRMWDWGGMYGRGVLGAKTVPNCVAYTQASRAAAIMRAFTTVHKLGWALADVFTWDQHDLTQRSTASPAIGAAMLYRWSVSDYKPMPGTAVTNYVRVYNQIFAGKLPVVVLHLQRIGDFHLEGATYLDSGAPTVYSPDGEVAQTSRRRQVMGDPKNIPSPEITGMVLGHDTDLNRGRPEFSYFDSLLRSAPCSDRDSRDAQAALNAMATFKFWKPLLIAEGITSDKDLHDAETTLGLLRDDMTAEIRAETIHLRSLENVRF